MAPTDGRPAPAAADPAPRTMAVLRVFVLGLSLGLVIYLTLTRGLGMSDEANLVGLSLVFGLTVVFVADRARGRGPKSEPPKGGKE